jgi:hypothetical protein
MEADALSGRIASLIFKCSRQMWVVRLSAWPLYCQRKGWSWRLSGCWNWTGCSGEEIFLLLLPSFEHQIVQHISESLCWLLPHNDMKERSILIKWDEKFGLNVFDLWKEFLNASLNMVISLHVLWKEISFSANLYSCNSRTVENGFWTPLMVILCHIACDVPLSLCCLIWFKVC